MRSMTGYGRGQSVHDGAKFTVELNSVNRKQNDVVVNLPRELAELEPRVRDAINTEVSRGRLTVVIAYHFGTGSPQNLALDRSLAKSYLKAMRDLQKELGVAGDIGIETILRAPGVIKAPEEQVSPDTAWPHVEKALKAALSDLLHMREAEGRHLAKDLEKRLKVVRDSVKKIRKHLPGVVKRYRESLHERIQRAGLELAIDDERLVKEVVVFADKSDVTEELTRLESHFEQFAAHLKKNEAVGRTLEFMCQEIGREFNTLGSKANDISISQLVVTCKAEMEKVREQIQNIE
jgi:uncharacterized protein (TIGR00255 family)